MENIGGVASERGVMIYSNEWVGQALWHRAVLPTAFVSQSDAMGGSLGAEIPIFFIYWPVSYLFVGYFGLGIGLVVEAMWICTVYSYI